MREWTPAEARLTAGVTCNFFDVLRVARNL
jgi:hypothetical protein